MNDRKKDHLDLTEKSQFHDILQDQRFNYEPLFGSLQSINQIYQDEISFLGKTLRAPIWVGSMTGGTREAKTINQNLARMAAEFGFGMGLGSCRPLLESNDNFEDFNIRSILGDELPLYANLGIAQISQLLEKQEIGKINDIQDKLKADGLIVHINPAQEWFQPEGDCWGRPAIEVLDQLIAVSEFKIIVKEVGQGMGPQSLKALMERPIEAIEFGAYGGTNFSYLEMLRHQNPLIECHKQMTCVGHRAQEMVHLINSIWDELPPENRLCRQFIASGGVKSYLDGYFYIEKLGPSAIYGQANAFLKYARGEYQDLQRFAIEQLRGLEFARQFLKVR